MSQKPPSRPPQPPADPNAPSAPQAPDAPTEEGQGRALPPLAPRRDPVRDAIPTGAEGDALLEGLFEGLAPDDSSPGQAGPGPEPTLGEVVASAAGDEPGEAAADEVDLGDADDVELIDSPSAELPMEPAAMPGAPAPVPPAPAPPPAAPLPPAPGAPPAQPMAPAPPPPPGAAPPPPAPPPGAAMPPAPGPPPPAPRPVPRPPRPAAPPQQVAAPTAEPAAAEPSSPSSPGVPDPRDEAPTLPDYDIESHAPSPAPAAPAPAAAPVEESPEPPTPVPSDGSAPGQAQPEAPWDEPDDEAATVMLQADRVGALLGTLPAELPAAEAEELEDEHDTFEQPLDAVTQAMEPPPEPEVEPAAPSEGPVIEAVPASDVVAPPRPAGYPAAPAVAAPPPTAAGGDDAAEIVIAPDDAAAGPPVGVLAGELPTIEAATRQRALEPGDLAAFDEEMVAEVHEEELEAGQAVDAVVALMQAGQRDAWVARADWLYEEAPGADQPADRSRTLLTAAELYAMCGEEGRAEAALREALELAPSCALTRRSLRALLMNRGEWPEVLELLDAETKIAATTQAQAHAACLGADVARLTLGDIDGANLRFDLAARAAADDVRPPLFRMAHGLASTDDVPPIRPADAPALQPLIEAAGVLSALRSNGTEKSPTPTTYSAMLRTREALRRRDIAGAVEQLNELTDGSDLGRAAAWLTSAVAAPHAELRAKAIESLGQVTEGTHGAIAVRTKALRALEAGDSDAAMGVANSAGEDVLTAADRLVLASLTGTPLDRLGAWLEAAGEVPDHAPLAAAAAAVLSDVRDSERMLTGVGSPEYRTAAVLGRQLASQCGHYPLEAGEVAARMRETADGRLREAAEDLLDAAPGSGAARAILLELAHSDDDVNEVAELLLGERDPDGPLGKERAQASALFAELGGDPGHLHGELERARATIPDDVATLRMGLEHAEPHEAARELAAFADAASEPTAAAVALTEAGLRLVAEQEDAEAEPLLQRAAELFPELPIAAFVGLQQAVRNGDVDGLRAWLQRRRDATPELADQAPDLVREALMLPDQPDVDRIRLLEEAHRARPADYGLRMLYEQAAGEAAADRAEWLLQRLDHPHADKATTALEAALACEFDGDIERAAECARTAAEADEGALAPIFLHRYALRGYNANEAVTQLATRYETLQDARDRRELAQVIADIELEGRGEQERSIGWLRTILGDDPHDLPTLRKLTRLLAAGGDPQLLETVSMNIARSLQGPEAAAHAMLAARLLEHAGRWDDTYEAVSIAFAAEPPGLWALRQMYPHARERGEHATAGNACLELAQRTQDPMEQATLTLRAAEHCLAAGDDDGAHELLGSALELWPDHYVVRLQRAHLLERISSVSEAASAFEQLAMVSRAPQQRAASLYQAATLWLSLGDHAGTDEGRRLLEAVAAIDPDYEDTFDRLKAIYVASGAKNELADLLDARLQTVTDPTERIAMEVLRGKVLAEAGAAAEARTALEAAIQASPDNPEALSAYADVCAAEQDWPAVEDSLIQLGRLVADPAGQADVYMRLGELYSEHLPNPERAELAYQEVLKQSPDHQEARQRLVDLFLQSGDTARAFEQQKALIDAAGSPSEQCQRVVRLAEIYEAAGDIKQAEGTLVKARRTFGKEPAAMVALYHFYRRNGQDAQADKLLERAAAEVRRGLGAGRFEPGLFGMVRTVAEMRGQHDTAEIAAATLSAIEGEVTAFSGCGRGAASPNLDAYTAPEVFTPAFRKLLHATGTLMELAVPLDLAALRARPLSDTHAHVAELASELALAYGVGAVQMYASNAIGPVCIPACTEPATLLFGVGLLDADHMAPREFLLHRALKLLQTRTAALSRTAPIDLWPLLAGYLKIHSPSFTPQGVDQRRFSEFHERMAAAGVQTDPQTSMVASEVIGGIGNRASSLNTVSASWGSRTALIAMGDPYVALMAVAWALGSAQGPPPAGPDRVKWISRKAEARDLIVFSVSDAYAQARRSLRGE